MSDKLPTKAEYDAAEPFAKGFMSYTFSAWPGSEIPARNPFKRGTAEAARFADGVHSATICAQDGEE